MEVAAEAEAVAAVLVVVVVEEVGFVFGFRVV